MYDLQTSALPWRERRRMLASSDIAPQRLGPESVRDLAHVAAGSCAYPELSVQRGVFAALRGLLLRVMAYAVVSRLCLMAAVWAASRVFTPGGQWTTALAISLCYLVFQLVGGFTQGRSEYTKGQLGHATTLYLATRINAAILELDPGASGAWSSGWLKNLLSSDVKYYAEYLAALAWNLVPALVSLLLLGPMIYLLAGWPGAVGILVSFAYVPFAVLFGRWMRLATAGQQAQLDSITTTVGEWLRNVRLSRYLGWQEAFSGAIAGTVRRYVRALLVRHLIACVTFGISFAWWMVPVVAMLVTSRLEGHPLDLVGFFATLWVIRDLNDYLQHLPHAINIRAMAQACLERIVKLEAAPRLAERLHRGATVLPAAAAVPVAVELRRVGFAYGDKPNVLHELSLRLDLSERTAIVGTVGSGKTTLLRLVCGDLAPSSGEVWIWFSDGVSAPLWDERIYQRYRDRVAYVPQEPFIANDTLAGNIALDDSAAAADPLRAAYMAELMTDIALLPQGFGEAIGEAGVNLSGGQRQRVNLARAFHSQRPVLCLDDPLSAVDERTEGLLMGHLLHSGCGFILISHRLARLQAAHRIVVLEQGEVVEDGAAAALWADAGSRFSRLREADRHG